MRDPMSEPNDQDYADQEKRRSGTPPMTAPAPKEWVEWRLMHVEGSLHWESYNSEYEALVDRDAELGPVCEYSPTPIKTRVTVIE